MSYICFNDMVQITPVTFDNDGVKTVGTSFETESYWEEGSEIKHDNNGNPIEPNVLVILPYGTDIEIGYKVKLVSKNGFTLTEKFKRERTAIRVDPIGDISPSHFEVKL